MRTDHVRRLRALETFGPRQPTAGDLATWAAFEALLESHGHLVDSSITGAVSPSVEHAVSNEAVSAAAVVDFVEAVKAIDPEAAAEFYRVVDVNSDLEASR